MTDKLRDAIAQQISEGLGATLRKFCDSPEAKQARHYLHAMPKSDWNTLIGMLAEESAGAARAALAAAPQPAPEEGLTRAQVGAMLDAKRHDREALVEAIRAARCEWANDGDGESCPDQAIADALLARGLRLPGDGSRNRVEYDDAGKLDEVVADAGMHLERMSDQGWFLSGQRSDGSEIAIWIEGRVSLVEERPAIRVVEGGDDE